MDLTVDSNLFAELPDASQNEVFQTLASSGDVLIERIVSRGQTTAAGTWLSQELNEWVALLQGEATLEFDGRGDVALEPGSWVLIPSGTRHRVARTSTDPQAVWIAVHFA